MIAPSDPIIAAIVPLLDDEGECPDIFDRDWATAHAVAAPLLPAKLSRQAECREAFLDAYSQWDGPEHVAAWVALTIVDENLADSDRVAQDLDDIKARVSWVGVAAKAGFDDLEKMPAILLRDLATVCGQDAPEPRSLRRRPNVLDAYAERRLEARHRGAEPEAADDTAEAPVAAPAGDLDDLRERLARKLDSLKMSQVRFATHAGLSQASVSKFLAGKKMTAANRGKVEAALAELADFT